MTPIRQTTSMTTIRMRIWTFDFTNKTNQVPNIPYSDTSSDLHLFTSILRRTIRTRRAKRKNKKHPPT